MRDVDRRAGGVKVLFEVLHDKDELFEGSIAVSLET
jgi:hypothetical protein